MSEGACKSGTGMLDVTSDVGRSFDWMCDGPFAQVGVRGRLVESFG